MSSIPGTVIPQIDLVSTYFTNYYYIEIYKLSVSLVKNEKFKQETDAYKHLLDTHLERFGKIFKESTLPALHAYCAKQEPKVAFYENFVSWLAETMIPRNVRVNSKFDKIIEVICRIIRAAVGHLIANMYKTNIIEKICDPGNRTPKNTTLARAIQNELYELLITQCNAFSSEIISSTSGGQSLVEPGKQLISNEQIEVFRETIRKIIAEKAEIRKENDSLKTRIEELMNTIKTLTDKINEIESRPVESPRPALLPAQHNSDNSRTVESYDDDIAEVIEHETPRETELPRRRRRHA